MWAEKTDCRISTADSERSGADGTGSPFGTFGQEYRQHVPVLDPNHPLSPFSFQLHLFYYANTVKHTHTHTEREVDYMNKLIHVFF